MARMEMGSNVKIKKFPPPPPLNSIRLFFVCFFVCLFVCLFFPLIELTKKIVACSSFENSLDNASFVV